MNTVVAVPAYGRDYKTEAEVRADWAADKDFSCRPGGGAYINKQDADRFGVTVQLRYDRLTKVVVIEPEPK